MNEKHYEEIIAADPVADIDGLDLSAEERAAAEAFRAEMQALDVKIAAALQLPVPPLTMPELPAIDAGNVTHISTSTESSKNNRFSIPVWAGLAASVALIAVIGANFAGLGVNESGSDTAYASLADEIVAHMDHETHAMVVSSTPVGEGDLNGVFQGSGAALDRDVGLITYARSCEINGKTVPHLVIQGENGPVTLLIMPDEQIDDAETVQGDNIRGVILPVGEGSIAIVGDREEDLGRIQEQVVDSVTWSI